MILSAQNILDFIMDNFLNFWWMISVILIVYGLVFVPIKLFLAFLSGLIYPLFKH